MSFVINWLYQKSSGEEKLMDEKEIINKQTNQMLNAKIDTLEMQNFALLQKIQQLEKNCDKNFDTSQEIHKVNQTLIDKTNKLIEEKSKLEQRIVDLESLMKTMKSEREVLSRKVELYEKLFEYNSSVDTDSLPLKRNHFLYATRLYEKSMPKKRCREEIPNLFNYFEAMNDEISLGIDKDTNKCSITIENSHEAETFCSALIEDIINRVFNETSCTTIANKTIGERMPVHQMILNEPLARKGNAAFKKLRYSFDSVKPWNTSLLALGKPIDKYESSDTLNKAASTDSVLLKSSTFCNNSSIICEGVPLKILKKSVMQNHFSAFGKIRNIEINTSLRTVIVDFEKLSSASAAKKHGRLILKNIAPIQRIRSFFGTSYVAIK